MTSDAQTTGPKLWTVLVRTYRHMAEVLETSVAEEGMCLSDFAVLEVLLHKGPLPISSIGDKVLLRNASMTSAVDRLETRGLVARVSSDKDRRICVVSLTECGRRLISEVFARHEQEIEEILADVDGAERDSLRSGLKKIGLKAAAIQAERAALQKSRLRDDRERR